MLSQRDSILRLLNDEDTETAELVERQLIERGPEVLPDLRALVATASGRVERRLRETVGEIERRIAHQELAVICSQIKEDSDIETISWAIAAAMRPGEDFAESRRLLDEWGRELTKRLVEAENIDEQHEILSDLLGGSLHFQGNEDDYYNLDNSLLPTVIESRLGLPISITLVYILVAKRAGLRVEGVGLPGHFIARLGNVFFDPFHGGRRLHLDECRNLMESQGQDLLPHHLLPCTTQVFLARMLNNILHIAVQEDDTDSARLVRGWLDALEKGVA